MCLYLSCKTGLSVIAVVGYVFWIRNVCAKSLFIALGQEMGDCWLILKPYSNIVWSDWEYDHFTDIQK